MASNQNIYNVNYRLVEANLTPPNHRTPKWLAWLSVLLYPLQWLHNNFFGDYANGSNYAFYNNDTVYNTGNRVIDSDNAVYECEANNVFNVSPHTNAGLAIGSYLFTSNGGTDNLGNGSLINMDGFTGPNGTTYTITIQGYEGQSFKWSDNRGNSGIASVFTHTSWLLSFGVVITWNNYSDTISVDGDVYTFTVSTNAVWWQVSPDYRGVRPQTNFNGTKLVLEGILNQFFRTTFRQPNNPQLPDIYIQNNKLNNNVFVIGESEAEASAAVALEFDALNYVVYGNSDYNFDGNDFTIFVPASLYWTFSPSGIASVAVAPHGTGYITAPTISFSGGYPTAGATATANVSQGTVVSVTMGSAGAGYINQPTVIITPTGGGENAKGEAFPFQTTANDNRIKNIASRYVIAGMTYNILLY